MKVDSGMQSFMEDNSEDDGDFPLEHLGSGGGNGTKSDRKSNKPIMEKRRRARINNCLNELKGILLEAMRKDPARHSKLEKADILELTVRHLQNVQRNQLAIAMATDPTVLHRFKNGFNECATEVGRYLGRLDGVETGVKQRLGGHLGACVNGLQQVGPMAFSTPRYSPLSSISPFVPPSPVTPNTHGLHPSAPQPSSAGLVSPPQQQQQQASLNIGDLNNNNSRYNTLNSNTGSALPSSTVTSGSGFEFNRNSSSIRPSIFANNTTPRRPPTPPPSPPALNCEQAQLRGTAGTLPSEHPNEKGTNTTPRLIVSGGNNNINNNNNGGGKALDFSLGKMDKLKRDIRDVRIGKVEPILKSDADSSSGGKDSMWRPW